MAREKEDFGLKEKPDPRWGCRQDARGGDRLARWGGWPGILLAKWVPADARGGRQLWRCRFWSCGSVGCRLERSCRQVAGVVEGARVRWSVTVAMGEEEDGGDGRRGGLRRLVLLWEVWLSRWPGGSFGVEALADWERRRSVTGRRLGWRPRGMAVGGCCRGSKKGGGGRRRVAWFVMVAGQVVDGKGAASGGGGREEGFTGRPGSS